MVTKIIPYSWVIAVPQPDSFWFPHKPVMEVPVVSMAKLADAVADEARRSGEQTVKILRWKILDKTHFLRRVSDAAVLTALTKRIQALERTKKK